LILRQGDVALEKIPKLPEGVRKIRDTLEILGETTGHKHFLEAEVFGREVAGETEIFVKTETPKVMTHPEHPDLLVPPGIYRVIQAREHENPHPVD